MAKDMHSLTAILRGVYKTGDTSPILPECCYPLEVTEMKTDAKFIQLIQGKLFHKNVKLFKLLVSLLPCDTINHYWINLPNLEAE